MPGFEPRAFSSSFLLEHRPPPPPSLSKRETGSYLSPPRSKPPKERERTNKSARAVRRDIVSCEVNHLRGSKTASSPRKNPFAASPPPLSTYTRGLEETFVTSTSVHIVVPRTHRHLSPFYLLLFFLFFFVSFLLSFFAVSPVSVNMRTHGLVISVIGSLTPARPSLRRGSVPRFFHGMADFLVSLL